MGPMGPGDPGAPGFPAGPAGPGRLQTSCEGRMVMLGPLLAEEYMDWERTTDSKLDTTHIWNMMVTAEQQDTRTGIAHNTCLCLKRQPQADASNQVQKTFTISNGDLRQSSSM